MPSARNKQQLIQNIILLWILRHGGEWPDWNGELGQLTLALTISDLANSVKNEKVRTQIRKALAPQITKLAQSAV